MMRSFRELTEAKETVVFGFGRFNPPTTGHEKLIEKVDSVSGSNPFFIYPSHTTGPKDPLPHAKKVAWMRKMFPKYKKNIIADRNAKTAIQIAEKLYKDGYKNLIMVAGSDRLKEFETLLNRYNDAPDKKGNQLFKFDSVKVVSAGERDPDTEGVEGMSASKMRDAAEKGDFDSFKIGIPSTLNDADKKKLYLEVRKNMGIREEREMGDDYDSLRDAYLTGKIWNVGEVVEAKGLTGEVVRKGTNYLSFVTEDGKVHKAWLHEIEAPDIKKGDTIILSKGKRKYSMAGITDPKTTLPAESDKMVVQKITKSKKGRKAHLTYHDTKKRGGFAIYIDQMPDFMSVKKEAKSPLQKLKDLDEGPKTHFVYQRDVPKSKRILHRGNEQSSKDWIKKNAKLFIHKGKDFDIYKGKSNNVLPADKLDWQYVAEEVELDERNYAKEYANYGGKPEQIARRSSRNKARRAMGDKAVKGMDVGHADNDPMNNDPKNLRMEKPSDNRREPRLREKRDDGYPDESVKIGKKHWIIYKDGRDWYGFEVDKGGNQIGDAIFDPRKSDLKTMLAKESLDEMAWYKVALAKISQLNHPKDYEKMVKRYAADMKNPELKNKTASYIAAKIANDYRGQDGRKLVQYINKLVDDGKLPKELKAEYQEEETLQTFSDLVKRINEVKQDKDVDDKKGTQPAKYYAGDMAKSTKSKRDAHFKSKKSGPAPGDADAKTKPSTHTKKFKQMYGEALPKDADQGDYIDDFEKSDAPQFKGKSKEKRKEMAIAAYLSKNESFLDNVNRMLSEDGHTDVASMKNKVQIAQKALMKMQGELDKLGDDDGLPTWWTNKVATAVSRLDDMSDYLDTQVESVELDEKIAGLVKKADKSGMSYSILKKVYDRGMAAWKTGHRPGTTPQQWAMARVNSFVTKSSGTWGKADKDLAKQVEQIEEACWVGYKQVGMKKKGNKEVPNCVPEEKELNEWGEIEEESEYQGRKVTLNKPSAGDVKKSKVYVKNEKGNVVKVNFGDPNMTIKKSNPARRKSFRARHNCENPGPKWMARYWSCKAW